MTKHTLSCYYAGSPKATFTKAIKEWKTLTKVKNVESFLGFANLY